MATKRQKAGKKAARTRALNTAKRRKAGKKAAETRKRRGTSGAPRARRASTGGGGSSFGGSVVNGFGIALGGVLLAALAYLVLAPVKKKAPAKDDSKLASTVDTTGLSPQESAIVLATLKNWNGSNSGECQCWKCN